MFTALDKSFHQKGENFTGRVVYFEIHAEVPDRAIWFYSELLDWKFTKIHEPPMAYWMVTTGPDSKPGINGGMHQRMAPITGLGVCSFVGTTCVADLDPVVEKAVALGGQIALPKMPIPGIGWLAYIRMVGLHQGHRRQHHEPDPTECSCQMKPTEFSWHPLFGSLERFSNAIWPKRGLWRVLVHVLAHGPKRFCRGQRRGESSPVAWGFANELSRSDSLPRVGSCGLVCRCPKGRLSCFGPI